LLALDLHLSWGPSSEPLQTGCKWRQIEVHCSTWM
jgi:hypothetical protein